MLSRRVFVGGLAAGAAAACAGSVGRAGAVLAPGDPQSLTPDTAVPDAIGAPEPVASMPPASEATIAPPPWELMRPLAMGSVVGYGWRVAALSGAEDGSCVLTLQNDRGRAHRVHLCRNDGQPQGLVYTNRFDLLVMNGGQGDLPTDEGLAQAVAEVAHVLAANESDARQAPVMTALLPHAERVERFAATARLR